MNKKLGVFIGVIAMAVFGAVGVAVLPQASQPVQAARFSTANATYIRSGETVRSSAYLAGDDVTVEGTIKGDLFCAGNTIKISGTVEGDIICAGANIEITGRAAGDMRLAGQSVVLRGEAGGNVSLLADTVRTEKTTKIGGDVNGAAANVRLAGDYGRDIALAAEQMTILGNVARDVEGTYQTLRLTEESQVGGRLSYVSPQEAQNNGKVQGEVTHRQGDGARVSVAVQLFVMMVAALFGLLLLAFILSYVIPKPLEDMAVYAANAPARPLLWGLAAALIMPLAVVIMLLSYVGVIAGIFMVLVWLVLVMVSGSVAAYLAGRKLLPRSRSVTARMMVGSLILLGLYLLPVVNVLVALAATIYGSGTVLGYLESRNVFARYRPDDGEDVAGRKGGKS